MAAPQTTARVTNAIDGLYFGAVIDNVYFEYRIVIRLLLSTFQRAEILAGNHPRPFDGDGVAHCDCGAVEYGAVPPPGSCDPGTRASAIE
jgi:hypothetical protein